MAIGPTKRAAASALKKATNTAKPTASRQPLRPAPTSPTAATKPAGVKASSPLSQTPPPPPPPPSAATAASPPQPTDNLSKEASSGGASLPPPPPPPPLSGGSEGQKGKGGGKEEAPPKEQPRVPFSKWKAAIWTLAFTAVTVTGTIYGAGLKTQKEWKEEKHKVQESTDQEKIETLVNRRAQLFKIKIEIEQKLADVRERMRLEKEKGEKEKSGAVAMPRR